MKNRKGLTLIELIGALALLAIVLGIAVVNVMRYREKLQEKIKINQLRVVFSEARNYYTKYHTTNCGVTGSPLKNCIRITANDFKKVGLIKYDDKFDVDPDKDKESKVFHSEIKKGNCPDSDKIYFYISFKEKESEDSYLNEYNDCGCEDQTKNQDEVIEEICINTEGKYSKNHN